MLIFIHVGTAESKPANILEVYVHEQRCKTELPLHSRLAILNLSMSAKQWAHIAPVGRSFEMHCSATRVNLEAYVSPVLLLLLMLIVGNRKI